MLVFKAVWLGSVLTAATLVWFSERLKKGFRSAKGCV